MQFNMEYWPIDRLTEYGNNPRIHEQEMIEKLATAIGEFGFRVPIVAKSDGMIVDGHMRLKAARLLGMEEVPVLPADDMSDEQIRAFRIAVNRMAELADWDLDLLADEIQGLDLDGFDLDLLGFDDDYLSDLLDIDLLGDGEDPSGEGEEEIPEPQPDPVSVLGDVWLLGPHRVMCGDSTNKSHLDQLAPEGWDVCVFDPPYEIEALYEDAMPAHVPGKKLIVMWDFKRFATASYYAIKSGRTPQYEFIWDNVQSWYSPNRPLQRHKALGVFSDDPFFDTKKSIIKDGKDRGSTRQVSNTRGAYEYTPLDGAKHIATVEQFPNTQQSGEHSHGKPIKWIRAIFAGVGGETYLDMFGGGGATLIACHINGQKCMTMELDPRYVDVIIRRWQNHTGKKATLEGDGRTFDEVENKRLRVV